MANLFEGTHQVTQSQLLRSSPGGDRVDMLDTGTFVSLVNATPNQRKGDDNDMWLLVQTKDGKQGWLTTKYMNALEVKKVPPKSVKEILEENGLSEYAGIFEQNKLTSVGVLADLTENDYAQIGITVLGDRKKLMKLFSGDTAAYSGSPGMQTSGNRIGQQIVIQTGAAPLPMKSMAAAILLPLFFGGFGMFYASVGMGILGTILNVIAFLSGFILWIPVWIIAIISTAVSVSGYNARLLEKSNENKVVTQ